MIVFFNKLFFFRKTSVVKLKISIRGVRTSTARSTIRIYKSIMQPEQVTKINNMSRGSYHVHFWGQGTHAHIVDVSGMESTHPPLFYRGIQLGTHPIGEPTATHIYFNNKYNKTVNQSIANHLVRYPKDYMESQLKDVTGTKEDFFTENPEDFNVIAGIGFTFNILADLNDRGFMLAHNLTNSKTLHSACKDNYDALAGVIIEMKKNPTLDIIINHIVLNRCIDSSLTMLVKDKDVHLIINKAFQEKAKIQETFFMAINREDPREVELITKGYFRTNKAYLYTTPEGKVFKKIDSQDELYYKNHELLDPNKPMQFVDPILSPAMRTVISVSQNTDISDFLERLKT